MNSVLPEYLDLLKVFHELTDDRPWRSLSVKEREEYSVIRERLIYLYDFLTDDEVKLKDDFSQRLYLGELVA